MSTLEKRRLELREDRSQRLHDPGPLYMCFLPKPPLGTPGPAHVNPPTPCTLPLSPGAPVLANKPTGCFSLSPASPARPYQAKATRASALDGQGQAHLGPPASSAPMPPWLLGTARLPPISEPLHLAPFVHRACMPCHHRSEDHTASARARSNPLLLRLRAQQPQLETHQRRKANEKRKNKKQKKTAKPLVPPIHPVNLILSLRLSVVHAWPPPHLRSPRAALCTKRCTTQTSEKKTSERGRKFDKVDCAI